MTQASVGVLRFRQIAFAMALFYWLWQFFLTDFSFVGWQFRYMTVWGLTGILITSALMLRLSMGVSDKEHASFVAAACVISGMVVLLYWRLYFDDPGNVNGKNGPGPWYREYYLHLVGPVLQWLDALFILGAFREFLRPLRYLIAFVICYALWIELVLQRFNDEPVGRVTTGLPYPFLNNLELFDRIMFYATNAIVAMIMLAIGIGLNWAVRRMRRA